MPNVVSVIRFTDAEREVLAGGGDDRKKLCQQAGAELKSAFQGIFNGAVELADGSPSRERLLAMLQDVDAAAKVLEYLTESEVTAGLVADIGRIRAVLNDALEIMPG